MRRLTVIAMLAVAACATEPEATDDSPSADDLAAFDEWAAGADGKSDAPPIFSNLTSFLRRIYVEDMSAIWDGQEYLTSAPAAISRIEQLVRNTGRDPQSTLYRVSVQKLVADPIDHSEVDIQLPDGTVIRLVGDPLGAGAFIDRSLFRTPVGKSLCLTHAELQTAVRASYVGGHYGTSFVCHTVTETVLRSLQIGTSSYSKQFRTYSIARFLWGPVVPSRNAQNPADWAVSRACP